MGASYNYGYNDMGQLQTMQDRIMGGVSDAQYGPGASAIHGGSGD